LKAVIYVRYLIDKERHTARHSYNFYEAEAGRVRDRKRGHRNPYRTGGNPKATPYTGAYHVLATQIPWD